MKAKIQQLGIAGLLFLGVGLFCGCRTQGRLTTNWIGEPVVNEDNPYFGDQKPSLRGYQIGLREDGIVVWRKIK